MSIVKCDICENFYKLGKNGNRHKCPPQRISSKGIVLTPIQDECPKCGKIKTNITRHLLTCGKTNSKIIERPEFHDCPSCKNSIKNDGNFIRHVKNCKGPKIEKPEFQECPVCKNSIKNNEHFNRHVKNCKGPKIEKPKIEKPEFKECPACKNSIKNDNHFSRHVKNCKGPKIEKPKFKECSICMGLIKNDDHFSRHTKNCKNYREGDRIREMFRERKEEHDKVKRPPGSLTDEEMQQAWIKKLERPFDAPEYMMDVRGIHYEEFQYYLDPSVSDEIQKHIGMNDIRLNVKMANGKINFNCKFSDEWICDDKLFNEILYGK